MSDPTDRSVFCPKCGERMEMSPSKSLQVCVFCGWSERTAHKPDELEAKREVIANRIEEEEKKKEKKFASRAEERRYNAAQEAKKKRSKPSVKRLDG